MKLVFLGGCFDELLVVQLQYQSSAYQKNDNKYETKTKESEQNDKAN
jgi:hypothetical protein